MADDEEDGLLVAKREPLRRIRKVQKSSTSSNTADATDELVNQLGSMGISKLKQPVGRFAEMRASRKSVAGKADNATLEIDAKF